MKYVKPDRSKQARGALKRVYDEVRDVFPGGEVPGPYLVHSFFPDFLEAYWNSAKASYFSGQCSRPEADAIACGVSTANACSFCLEAHAELLRFSDAAMANSALKRQTSHASNPHLQSLVKWGRATLTPNDPLSQSPSFARIERADAIAVALSFHYTNRLVNIFFGPSPFPLAFVPGARNLMTLIGRPMFRALAEKTVPLENSKSSARDAVISASELEWADNNQRIQIPFCELSREAERVGEECVPSPAREVIHDIVNQWNGEELPIDGGEVLEHMSRLDDSLRPIARLTLFAGLASHRVNSELVKSCRLAGASDHNLVGASIWGSHQATTRIATWL